MKYKKQRCVHYEVYSYELFNVVEDRMQLEEMELIYLYIERFGDFICQQELVLSNNFDVSLKNKKLIVHKKENHLKDFYGKKIKNLTVLVGKNGSGKTTILDILGMNRNDRLNIQEPRKQSKNEYFMLYYLGKSDQNDLFGIEVTSDNLLRNMIENYKHTIDDEGYDKSKRSIGKVYRYENDTFISMGKHFFDFKINHAALSSLIKYVYLGEEYRYSFRNSGYGLRYYQDSYGSERDQLPYPDVYYKYLVINDCINGKIDAIKCNEAIVGFKDNIDYKHELAKQEFDDYRELLLEIEKTLCILNGMRTVTILPKGYTQKEKYNLDLYSRYIMDMLVTALSHVCFNAYKSEIAAKKIESVNTMDYIEHIKNINACDSSENIFGRAVDYKEELKHVLILSKNLEDIYIEEPMQHLRILMRYINSRLHSNNDCSQYKYVEAFEKIIDNLIHLSEECFVRDGVRIDINGKKDFYTKKLLENYSYYHYLENRDDYPTNMTSKFRIYFQMLSEGEERFIDILAKITESIDENNTDAKLLILLMDEPDQSLHPEWSRCFIDIITRAINSTDFAGKTQVVMSTHSPYLLSDILPSGIFMLSRNLTDRYLSITGGNNDKLSGLGANIYDLMQNEFFMKNTIGEFATKKINQYIRKIDELDLEKESDFREIEFFISQIGEPLIKKTMQMRLNEKQHKYKVRETSKKLLELINNDEDRKRVEAYLSKIED